MATLGNKAVRAHLCWPPQILGFPLETAAVLLLPYFGVKYFIDKDSVSEDISAAVVRALLWCNLLAHCFKMYHVD